MPEFKNTLFFFFCPHMFNCLECDKSVLLNKIPFSFFNMYIVIYVILCTVYNMQGAFHTFRQTTTLDNH